MAASIASASYREVRNPLDEPVVAGTPVGVRAEIVTLLERKRREIRGQIVLSWHLRSVDEHGKHVHPALERSHDLAAQDILRSSIRGRPVAGSTASHSGPMIGTTTPAAPIFSSIQFMKSVAAGIVTSMKTGSSPNFELISW